MLLHLGVPQPPQFLKLSVEFCASLWHNIYLMTTPSNPLVCPRSQAAWRQGLDLVGLCVLNIPSTAPGIVHGTEQVPSKCTLNEFMLE